MRWCPCIAVLCADRITEAAHSRQRRQAVAKPRSTSRRAPAVLQRAAAALQACCSTGALAPDGQSDLPPLQQAQAQVAEMEAALALSQCLHTLQGDKEAFDAAIRAELNVLAAYKTKVLAAVAKQELAHSKRTTEVNIDAAHRFITHAIPDLSAQTRAGLKQVRHSVVHLCRLLHIPAHGSVVGRQPARRRAAMQSRCARRYAVD